MVQMKEKAFSKKELKEQIKKCSICVNKETILSKNSPCANCFVEEYLGYKNKK
jgi:hypothetical protein